MIFFALVFSGNAFCVADSGKSEVDMSKWHIADIYKYCTTNIDENTSDEEKERYARFFIECQDAKTGNFIDAYGDTYYSVKVYHVLKRLGYQPKYPLGVCQQAGEDYCEINGIEVTEQMPPGDFRRWLDKIRDNCGAYSAGSLFGHFITPHVMNLEKAGKSVDDSPFVKVFHEWLLANQGENGFWNRPDDTDYNGWNGVMKMDSALGKSKIRLPHPDRMMRTVLKHQRQKDGNFTTAGGCTNHNALHTLRKWSQRCDLLMWEEIFCAMEHFTECLERRYEPVSGYFRPPPGFKQKPEFRATELASMAIGNVIGYCGILLNPDNAEFLEKQRTHTDADAITADQMRKLLVRAAGLRALANEKVKAHVKAEHEKKYGN